MKLNNVKIKDISSNIINDTTDENTVKSTLTTNYIDFIKNIYEKAILTYYIPNDTNKYIEMFNEVPEEIWKDKMPNKTYTEKDHKYMDMFIRSYNQIRSIYNNITDGYERKKIETVLNKYCDIILSEKLNITDKEYYITKYDDEYYEYEDFLLFILNNISNEDLHLILDILVRFTNSIKHLTYMKPLYLFASQFHKYIDSWVNHKITYPSSDVVYISSPTVEIETIISGSSDIYLNNSNRISAINERKHKLTFNRYIYPELKDAKRRKISRSVSHGGKIKNNNIEHLDLNITDQSTVSNMKDAVINNKKEKKETIMSNDIISILATISKFVQIELTVDMIEKGDYGHAYLTPFIIYNHKAHWRLEDDVSIDRTNFGGLDYFSLYVHANLSMNIIKKFINAAIKKIYTDKQLHILSHIVKYYLYHCIPNEKYKEYLPKFIDLDGHYKFKEDDFITYSNNIISDIIDKESMNQSEFYEQILNNEKYVQEFLADITQLGELDFSLQGYFKYKADFEDMTELIHREYKLD